MFVRALVRALHFPMFVNLLIFSLVWCICLYVCVWVKLTVSVLKYVSVFRRDWKGLRKSTQHTRLVCVCVRVCVCMRVHACVYVTSFLSVSVLLFLCLTHSPILLLYFYFSLSPSLSF